MSSTRRKTPDILLVVSIGALVFTGLLAFASASLGLLARGTDPVGDIVASHLILGLGLGSLAFFFCTVVPYATWKRFAPHLFAASIILTALIFLPGIGLEHGGSRRWLALGPLSLQPSEPLKMGLILALAAYFTHFRGRLSDWRYGLGGFLALIAAPAIFLLLQPDHGTFGVLMVAGGAMFFASGAPLRQIAVLILAAAVLLGAILLSHDYTRARITTFLNPGEDKQKSSYQVTQSLYAIGAGELMGRGFGQGLQKFHYLPEPVGDSIFAVIGEEFGFVGTTAIVLLFALFFLRGYSVAARAPDYFGGLLAVGITTYVSAHFFFNVASMLGLMPLTGIPLIFISQGGTALFIALGAAGILVNISRQAKRG